MCDECAGGKPGESPGGGPQPRGGLSRRAVLAMGTSVAAGVALGLWNCQNPAKAPEPGKPGTLSQPTTTTAGSTAASTTSNATSETSTASTQGTGPATTAEGMQSAPASSRAATPDLGAEVFPDAAGKAMARASDAPVIMVPRTDWTSARPDLTHIEVMDGVSRITVHHTAGAIETDAWKPTAGELEGIREFHAGTRPTDRNWADIAYHFAVDRAGRVWQARPLAYQGAHARGHNAHNLGIVLLGNFAVQSPSAAQLTSLGLFIGFVRKLYGVPLDQVFTHGELVDTECPGRLLQEYMDRGRAAWGEAEGKAWSKVGTYPASDPAASSTRP